MLTDAQVTLYGRRWGVVCTVNRWRMERGRLDDRARLGGSEWHEAVAERAELHARQNSRAVTVEDLRRGCGHLISGRFISTKDFSNKQFSRLLVLFRLLLDPQDLEAVMDWQQVERASRASLVEVIGHLAPLAYIDSICRDRFAAQYTAPFWQDLPMQHLQWLLITLRNRAVHQDTPVERTEAEVLENQPF